MSEPKKVGRRTFLNYATAIVATGVIVGAATYLATPKGATTTVTVPAATTTVTVPGAATTVTAPGATTTVTAPGGKTTTGVPQGPLKIGLTTFLSGSAALEGSHAEATAELFVEEVNASGGILGRKVELVKVDEAIGTDALIKAVRKIVTEDKVEFITGLVSSGDGTSLAPIIEKELFVPTVYSTATTKALIEDVDPNPKFIFRASNYDPVECIAAARIVVKYFYPDVKKVAGINPDYAFGRDEWAIFTAALKKFKPDVEFVYEAWPKLGTTDFTSHISALLASGAELVYSSLFAGDLMTFVRQAGPMGFFKKIKFVDSVCGSIYSDLKKDWFPEGVLAGMRQCWWTYPPNFPFREQFFKKYFDRTKRYPIYTGIATWQGLMAFKNAVELGYSLLGYWPDADTIAKLMERTMSMMTPVGYRYCRPEDHQTVGNQIFGVTKHVPEYDFCQLDPLYVYPPEEVTPPPKVKTLDWINSW
jgi:branched-chain amino acid transport system substrate-binding protein